MQNVINHCDENPDQQQAVLTAPTTIRSAIAAERQIAKQHADLAVKRLGRKNLNDANFSRLELADTDLRFTDLIGANMNR